MSADYTIAQLDAVQAGTAAADTLLDIGNAARNAACSFFKSYPDVVIPNPAFSFLEATWDGLCKNSTPGLPPNPQPKFNGGQCVCTAYTFHFTVNYTNFGTAQTPIHATTILYGPVGNPYLGDPNSSGNRNQIYVQARNENSDGSCGTSITTHQFYGIGTYYSNITSFTIDSVSGSPDTCGNAPPKYPPSTTPPTPIPPSTNIYNLPNVSITFNDGSNWTVAPTLQIDTNFGPVINFNNLNISVGGGGVTISPPPSTLAPPTNINNINLLNNVTNTLNNTSNNVSNQNTTLNNVNTNVNTVNSNLNTVNTNVNTVNSNVNTVNSNVNTLTTNLATTNTTVNSVNTTVTNINTTVNNVKAISDSINKHTKPTPKPTDTGITTITVASGIYTVTSIPNLISAQVILTTLPTKAEIRFGADPNYNVYVGGFFSWLQNGEAIQRIPLQYKNNINFAPLGCDGYSYTLVDGAQGYSVYSEDNS